MDRNTLDADFQAYRERGDVDALVRVFDAAAPRLLLLAAHLVARADEAEDLVQATFLAALRDAKSYGGERPVLAWLAGILRHRALDLARRRSVRGEQSLADVDGLRELEAPERSPIDLAADGEAFERVAAAIATLEAPYRELLTLRLVHGLDPAAIAHARGANPSTVRVQLMRGLERLRAALPDPSALLGVGLVALVAGEHTRGLAAVRDQVLAEARALPTLAASSPVAAPAVVAGAAWSRALLVLGASVALVAGLVAWVARPAPVVQRTAVSTAETRLDPSLSMANTMQLAVADSSTARRDLRSTSTGAAPAVAGPSRSVRGMLLHADGSPAAGFAVTTSGQIERAEHVAALEPPPSRWTGASTTTNEAGAFELSIDADVAPGLRVRAESPGWPTASWLLPELPPGSTIDLGTCTLPRSGSVEGRIVQPDGSLADGQWVVMLTTHWAPPLMGEAPLDTNLVVDVTEGVFVIAGVPFGPFEVSGYPTDRPFGWVPFVSGVVKEAEPSTFELRAHSNESRPRSVVHLVRRLVSAFPPIAVDSLSLVDQDGVRHDGVVLENEGYRLAIEDLPIGTYTLELVEERHELEAPVHLGANDIAVAKIRGSVDIELSVVERESGEPIENWYVHVHPASQPKGFKWSGNWLRWKSDSTGSSTHFATVPDSQSWTIEAEGFETLELDHAAGFDPHSTRVLEVELTRSQPISGRILHPDGSPAAGVTVRGRPTSDAALETPKVNWNPDAVAARSWIAWSRTTTDSNGAFELRLAKDVPHDVSVLTETEPETLATSVAPSTSNLELTIGSRGRIAGSVVNAFAVSNWTVTCSRVDEANPSISGSEPGSSRIKSSKLNDDGSFAVEALLPGDYVVTIRPPQRTVIESMGEAFVPNDALTLSSRVTVTSGHTTPVELDADCGRLGRVVVVARDGGRPAIGLNVVALAPGFGPGVWTVADADLTDESGRAELDWLLPGEWRIAVCPIDGAWSVASDTPVAVESGTTIEREIAFETATRRVRFVDRDGQPLVRHIVSFAGCFAGTQHFDGGSTGRSTDDAGELTITLTTGSHTVVGARPAVSDDDASPYAPTVIEWPAGDATIEVLLQRL